MECWGNGVMESNTPVLQYSRELGLENQQWSNHRQQTKFVSLNHSR